MSYAVSRAGNLQARMSVCLVFMYWTLLSNLYASISSFTSLHPPGNVNPLTFNLQHVYMSTPSNGILFANIRNPKHVQALGYHSFKLEIPSTRRLAIPRASPGLVQKARQHSRVYGESTVLDWLEDQVDGPDVSSRDVLETLAKMTANAYIQVADKDWYDLSHQWNSTHSFPFGWNPSDDGFRGHVFVSEDNSTVVLSVKGTSGPWVAGGGGPTVKKDKLNDNLLFSCCCARVGPTWSTVCDCYDGSHRCEESCVQTALQTESLFYHVGIVCFFPSYF